MSDLMGFIYGTGIVALLAKISYDLGAIKTLFGVLDATVLDHGRRILQLENERDQKDEKLD